MGGQMITLGPSSLSEVGDYLNHREPWHMIALEALGLYGLNDPRHQWFVEVESGRLKGVVYRHGELVHLAYDQAPAKDSPLYTFLQRHIPQFTTHGKQDVVEPIVNQLPAHRRCLERSHFLIQSSQTRLRLQQYVPRPTGLTLRSCQPQDLSPLLRLFQGSEVESEVDPPFIRFLVRQKRIIVAEYRGRMIGSIMRLKETPRYALLGNLFVHPGARKRGIATLLGQQMILQCMQEGKKVCFFYSDPKLKEFYAQAAFQPLGHWVHYSVTSKATT